MTSLKKCPLNVRFIYSVMSHTIKDCKTKAISGSQRKYKGECWVPAYLCIHMMVFAFRWCYRLHFVGRSVVNCFCCHWLVMGELTLLCSRSVYNEKRFLLRDIPQSRSVILKMRVSVSLVFATLLCFTTWMNCDHKREYRKKSTRFLSEHTSECLER